MSQTLKTGIARQAVESTSDMFFHLDGRGRILFVNNTVVKKLGYTVKELIGANLEDLAPDIGKAYDPRTKRPIKNSAHEIVIFNKEGRRLPSEAVFVDIGDRNERTTGVFIRDITLRKTEKTALWEGHARFASAFQDVAIGVIVFSTDGRFLEVNPYACKVLGYSERELLSKTFNDLTHPDDREISMRTDQEIIDGVIPAGRVEKRYFTKNKSEIWVISSSVLVRDEKGVPMYFISHIQDITERKKAEENLREVNTALKVLLDHREQEKIQQARDMLANLDKLAMPYLDRLLDSRMTEEQKALLEIIKTNLTEVAAPFAERLSSIQTRLTPAELEVADMLRHGKTTDEIASILNVSPSAISFHRKRIRKKLGLTNKKVNLKSYLQTQF